MEPISSNDTFNDLQRFLESWDEEDEIITGVPAAIERPELQTHPQASHDQIQELNPVKNSSSSFYVDDYQLESCQDPVCAYETVWSGTQLSENSNSFPACKICMTHSANVSTPCGHVFCLSCLTGWLKDEAKPCPECNTLLSLNAITSNANIPESSLVTPESMIYQDPTLEYQPVWQAQSHGPLQNEAVVDAVASSERKRGRQKTMVVDHDGVAMRFDGVEERFTAYYRPSYWTEDDSAVFLGEYPTFEEGKDAYNLVALLHEGPHVQMDLAPFTVDRYAEELKRWEGKHHVDLLCELRLRGRGFLKDGSVNYKNVGRRRSTKKAITRYYSTVLFNDPGPSNTVNTAKPKRTFQHSFDNPEQAARLADETMVKEKGVYAWTNFPLSSYITCPDELPLTFLPLTNNFRENLNQRRARDFLTRCNNL